jgi:hypothetical protein
VARVDAQLAGSPEGTGGEPEHHRASVGGP